MCLRPYLATLLLLVLVCAVGSDAAPAAGSERRIEVSGPLPYVRIFCDAAGASRFEDLEMSFSLADFAPPAPPISVSDPLPAEAVAIISSPAGWRGDWHPAPRRQLMIVLSGGVEVEVSNGVVRRFAAGDVILVEDTDCVGHVSRIVGEERCSMATIPLRHPS